MCRDDSSDMSKMCHFNNRRKETDCVQYTCMGDAKRVGPLSFVGHRYMFRDGHCVLGSQFMGKTCALTISVGGEFHLQ